MSTLFFTSALDEAYRDALERLFYYNENQNRHRDAVLAAVERYGLPHIEARNSRLWVTLESGIEAQSLFVMQRTETTPELVGAIVYTRDDDKLVVAFMAVREDHAYGGEKDDGSLSVRMIDELRGIAGRIKGITSLTLFLHGPVAVRLAAKVKGNSLWR